MASSSTYAFFHCHYAFQKFPFFCVTLCVLHALQNVTELHSAEHAKHTQIHEHHYTNFCNITTQTSVTSLHFQTDYQIVQYVFFMHQYSCSWLTRFTLIPFKMASCPKRYNDLSPKYPRRDNVSLLRCIPADSVSHVWSFGKLLTREPLYLMCLQRITTVVFMVFNECSGSRGTQKQ